MKRLLKRTTTKLTVAWAAGLLAGATLISTLLGLARERLLLANFGVGSDVDAYKAAFAVPDFMFFILVSGALSVTFIPVLNERLIKGNKRSAWELSSSLLNFMALLTLVASILIMIFADPLVRYVVAPGLDPATQDLAINMMRIIAINPFLFAISTVLTSMQQAFGRFFFYALAPSLYNIGIILGILFIAPSLGIVGVAVGVIIGSILQLIAAVFGMIGLGFEYESKIYWRNHGFRRVLQLLPPRSTDQGIDYFNTLVETNLASRLKAGSITAYQTAFTLHLVPVTVIGVAISTAAFPQLSERLNQGRPDLFKKEFTSVLRWIIWFGLPVAIIAYFGRGYLVRLLVAEGNPVIASTLAFFVGAIFFRTVFHIVSRSFYAQKDTKTPLYVSIVAIALNIVLAVYLSQETDLGVRGLALAQSIVAFFEVLVLMLVLVWRFPGLITKRFTGALVRMGLATGMTAVVTYAAVLALPLRATDVGFFSLVPKFTVITGLSLLSYVAFSYILGLKESRPIVDRVNKFIFKPVKIQ